MVSASSIAVCSMSVPCLSLTTASFTSARCVKGVSLFIRSASTEDALKLIVTEGFTKLLFHPEPSVKWPRCVAKFVGEKRKIE